MIGIIVPAVKGYVTPFDPDTAFDPTTHIATEEAFIQLLENGIYDEKYIGYMVTLSNSAAYDGGIWVIADVNHDSANTGQTDCYDLISRDCFNPGGVTFGSSDQWRSSNVRTWLNSTFYSGFSSDLKNRLIDPKYNSYSTWYTDDKVILPSFTEVNGNVPNDYSGSFIVEGTKYPIFESGSSSRIKNQFSGSGSYWWTRSRITDYSSYVWMIIIANGSMNYDWSLNSNYVAPIIRVH